MAELAGLSPRSGKGRQIPAGNSGGAICGVAEAEGKKTDRVFDDGDDGAPKNKNNFSIATKKYLLKYGLMNDRSVSFLVPDGDGDEDDEDARPRGKEQRVKDRNSDSLSTTSSSSSSSNRRSNMVLDLHKIQHLPNLT